MTELWHWSLIRLLISLCVIASVASCVHACVPVDDGRGIYGTLMVRSASS